MCNVEVGWKLLASTVCTCSVDPPAQKYLDLPLLFVNITYQTYFKICDNVFKLCEFF